MSMFGEHCTKSGMVVEADLIWYRQRSSARAVNDSEGGCRR